MDTQTTPSKKTFGYLLYSRTAPFTEHAKDLGSFERFN